LATDLALHEIRISHALRDLELALAGIATVRIDGHRPPIIPRGSERNRGFALHLLEECVELDEAEVGVLAGAVLANGDALRFDFLVADHERVRNLRELRVANHRIETIVRRIDL